MKPKLQIALDLDSLQDTVVFLSNREAIEPIDIIEVGTVLLASEGKKAIEFVKKMYPDKIIVADLKIADAATVLTKMFMDAGADYVTVIASADIQSMINAQKVAEQLEKTIQIELYGNWDLETAKEWLKVGIKHIIYHHSRDSDKEWGAEDIKKIEGLISIGFEVNVTGGIHPSSIEMFKGMDVYSFIVGRSIYLSSDVHATVSVFKESINACFDN